MQSASEKIQLTASQAACLHVLRDGVDSKTKIAIKAKLNLKAATATLKKLERLRLVKQSVRYRWQTTRRGQSCCVEVMPDRRRRLGGAATGKLAAGSGAERLLDVLDRPMRSPDLAKRLGISRARVRQLIIMLLARGQLRVVDDEKNLHIVARIDDPTILLSRDEERILSVLPDDCPTSAAKIRAATRVSAEREEAVLASLRANGLIENVEGPKGNTLYGLTAAGSEHPQRKESIVRAHPPPLKVQSDRVFAVLSHIAEKDEIRIKDVGDALEIPYQSMNSLMQYLKRSGLVGKIDHEFKAPYILTDEGHGILVEMAARREKSSCV